MRLTLRTGLIIVLAIFVLVIIMKVTGFVITLFNFITTYSGYFFFLFLLLIVMVMVVIYLRRQSAHEDWSRKAFYYLDDWWANVMGHNEHFKLEDSRMSEGWYGNEKFYGFNCVKMGSHQRFIAVVGINPLRVTAWDNSSLVREDHNPFACFSKLTPKPTQDTRDEEMVYEERMREMQRRKIDEQRLRQDKQRDKGGRTFVRGGEDFEDVDLG